ncbi:MAG: 50S ribosomal protein L12 [Candidatus Pacearchaeota archaeon]
MKYIYAALLLHEAGKEINEENLKKVISSIDEVDEAKIKILVESLRGVNIEELIKSAPTTVTISETKEKVEEKKEEKKEERIEEISIEGLASLFG